MFGIHSRRMSSHQARNGLKCFNYGFSTLNLKASTISELGLYMREPRTLSLIDLRASINTDSNPGDVEKEPDSVSIDNSFVESYIPYV